MLSSLGMILILNTIMVTVNVAVIAVNNNTLQKVFKE